MFLPLLAWIQEAATQSTGATPTQTAQPQESMLSLLIMPLAIFVIFYFLLIRPQRKQQKERANMLNQIKKGDRVMTNGGLFGTIVSLKENEVVLEVDENVRLRFSRAAIAQVVTSDEKSKELATK